MLVSFQQLFKPCDTSLASDGLRKLIHSAGGITAKLCILMHLLDLAMDTERWLSCMKPLDLNRDKRYGSC